MATAEKKEGDYEVFLTLSKDEAETLRLITNYIGGSPHHSPRKHMDSICVALSYANVPPANEHAVGSVIFK